MGTYTRIVLKDKTEKNIKRVNALIEEEGIYTPEIYEGVEYGLFVTREQLKEDARFMNEDTEGLKQNLDQKRPITTGYLSQFFWNTIGECNYKLNSGEPKMLKSIAGASKYLIENNLIDESQSDNYEEGFIMSYSREYEESPETPDEYWDANTDASGRCFSDADSGL